MGNIGKISSFQMLSILFLCRIISLFTFMLPSAGYIPSGDRILTPVVVLIFEIIYSAFLNFAVKRTDGNGIISSLRNKNEVTAKIIAVIYTLAFIWFAGIGTARFELFISTVMFPNSELYLMIFLLLAAAFYASLKGLEAIGRVSVILLFLIGTSIAFILISVTGEFRTENLSPIFTKGASPLVSFSFYVSVRAAELMTLHITAPDINGSTGRTALSFSLLFSAVSTVILTALAGVTGEFGNDQIFPLYTLTVIAKFGIFERLDDILTGIWVLCSFIQLSFLINTGMRALNQGFGKIKKIPVCFLITSGIFIVYLLTARTVSLFSEAVSSRAVDVIYIALMIIIPVFVSLISGRRRRLKH
jgi:hypothetical protein